MRDSKPDNVTDGNPKKRILLSLSLGARKNLHRKGKQNKTKVRTALINGKTRGHLTWEDVKREGNSIYRF